MITNEQVAERIKNIVARLNETLNDETLRNDGNGIDHFCAACTARNSLVDLVTEMDGTERAKRELRETIDLIDRSPLSAEIKLGFVRGHVCDALHYVTGGRDA